MTDSISRRDFLRLGLVSSTLLSPPVWRMAQADAKPNILIILFDSWSETNLALSGYPRQTMPFLSTLADKAIIYRNHYSGGNFTTPGTASLLTGTHPQTHRAFSGNSKVISPLAENNIFSAFRKGGYQTIAYSHNTYANTLLRQFSGSINNHIPSKSLYLNQSTPLDVILGEDLDTVVLSRSQILLDTPASSLILSRIYSLMHARRVDRIQAEYAELFPGGLPNVGETEFYDLEKGIDYILETLPGFGSPYLAYFHFLPPHGPYKTRREFYQYFRGDSAEFPDKPEHILTEGYRKDEMLELRQTYDDYLLYVDSEFNRLYQQLSSSGLLENTVLVLTSDHGEMFERGIVRHGKATLHEPVIRIPLMLFMPGQRERMEIYDRSAAMDVLPTLADLAQAPIPDTAKGVVLPPFGSPPPADRPVVIPHAEGTQRNQPLGDGSFTIFKGDYKLTRYIGFSQIPNGEPLDEIYNLADDPEELHDLSKEAPAKTAELAEELEEFIDQSNQPYRT